MTYGFALMFLSIYTISSFPPRPIPSEFDQYLNVENRLFSSKKGVICFEGSLVDNRRPSEKDLKDYFYRFGYVYRVRRNMQEKRGIVVFDTEEQAQQVLLNDVHSIANQNFKVFAPEQAFS